MVCVEGTGVIGCELITEPCDVIGCELITEPCDVIGCELITEPADGAGTAEFTELTIGEMIELAGVAGGAAPSVKLL